MTDQDFYEKLEEESELAWKGFESCHQRQAKQTYYSNTNLIGIPELHQFVDDCTKAFNLIFGLVKMKPSLNQEAREAVLFSLRSLKKSPAEMDKTFAIVNKYGERDPVYTLQDYVY